MLSAKKRGGLRTGHARIFSRLRLKRLCEFWPSFPGVGTPYEEVGVSGLRRLYLRKINCHLYYTFDEREVIIRALWGARRRRGPRIKP